jgi:mannose-6-phosphate isomerase
VKAGRTVGLDSLIANNLQRILGQRVAAQYRQLPYLLKILDVEQPLSIQVHPTKSQAEAGFERENQLGIPLDAPERNYRDNNHKPELMVALGDFWLLHGFLPEEKLLQVLRDVAEFQVLTPIFELGGIAGLYRHVMEMPAKEADSILAPIVRRACSAAGREGLPESSPDFWVTKVAAGSDSDHFDRGIFSLYFFNLVRLTAGQAIFQDAGIPHAYLRGQNIEIMANSDNVLRGGLTTKHVDVPELLRAVRFEGIHPQVMAGPPTESRAEVFFQAPTEDFCLSRLELGMSKVYIESARSIEILLVMEGTAELNSLQQRLSLGRGQSALLIHGTDYRLSTSSERVVLFRASIPD